MKLVYFSFFFPRLILSERYFKNQNREEFISAIKTRIFAIFLKRGEDFSCFVLQSSLIKELALERGLAFTAILFYPLFSGFFHDRYFVVIISAIKSSAAFLGL